MVRAFSIALVFVGLFAGLVGPARAAPDTDGVYGGAITCSKIGLSPGFSQSLGVIVRDGRFSRVRGTAGEIGYEELKGEIDADGAVRIAGLYIADEEKQILFEGRVEGPTLRASGMRGPRKCDVKLDGPALSGAPLPYRLPPEPEGRRAAVGRNLPGSFTCPEPPAPLRDVIVEPFYERGDTTHSVVNAQAYAARSRAVEPLSALASGIARLGDRYLQTPSRNPVVAACIASWIETWAAADAMLGQMTMQGQYERKWTLATLALNYALLSDAPEIPDTQRAKIERWLRELGWATVPEYARKPFGEQNNHLYWAALATMAAAAATGDRPLFDWAIAATRAGLRQIGPDGALERELARKSKALHYHRFSVEPLVLAVAIARANGIELGAMNDGALGRLVAFTLAGLEDPEPIARRVGAKQEFVGTDRVSPSMYAWAEIYLAGNPDETLAATLEKLRGTSGLSQTWLGGNLTLRFAAPKP